MFANTFFFIFFYFCRFSLFFPSFASNTWSWYFSRLDIILAEEKKKPHSFSTKYTNYWVRCDFFFISDWPKKKQSVNGLNFIVRYADEEEEKHRNDIKWKKHHSFWSQFYGFAFEQHVNAHLTLMILDTDGRRKTKKI